MILQSLGRGAPVMNKDFITDSILKFHQLSNPLKSLPVNTDIDVHVLKNNTENYSQINLKEYSIQNLSKPIIELDAFINNIQNKNCAYFPIFSFYTDDLIEEGNYAYNSDYKKLIKYSELKNKHDTYQISVSFFVSLYNSFYKYGGSAFVKSILAIGEVLERIESFCHGHNFLFTEDMHNFNQTAFNLQIDSLKQLYITTVYMKGI